MDEQQILEQLNSLDEEVKPREKWVNLTKKELFENENAQQQQTAATLISKAFGPLQRPALALAGIGVIAMLLSGSILYSPQLVKIDEPMPRIGQNSNPQLAASVEKLNESLSQINGKLATLENSKNIREVIPKLAAIRTIAQQGIEVTNTQTLAAMGGTEISKNLESIVERTNKISSSSAKILINNVEANEEFLTSEEQGRLEKAKKAYKEGNYTEILVHLSPFLQ